MEIINVNDTKCLVKVELIWAVAPGFPLSLREIA